jgi:hypothetical protein
MPFYTKKKKKKKKKKKQEFAMSPIVKGLIEVKPSLLLGTLGCQPFGYDSYSFTN